MRHVLAPDVHAVMGDYLREQPIRHPMRVVTVVAFLTPSTPDGRAMGRLGTRFLEVTTNALELAVFAREFLP